VNAPSSPSPRRIPNQRWRIAKADPHLVQAIAQSTSLSPLLAQVLLNRGITTPEEADLFLNPETQTLPSPLDEFPDLAVALDFLMGAIAKGHKIAICGDYDADGMTSTALLLRALRHLGAVVDYAIPSRMSEGYGINRRIVEEFCQEGVRVILTVDNGIAAYDPIARARELGLVVIVTDHHDIPEQLPPAHAILNPKLIRESSPYCGIAGVGVAYILAVCLAQCLNQTQDLTTPLLELFTLGTIADLAPLTGVNRRWLRRGLQLLPRSTLPGVQALIQVAGLSHEQKTLKPEAIGFRLGPRINAVGRIADPQLVIELLTTEDMGRSLELAMTCEEVNQHRQRLCELIEQEAIAWCETEVDIQRDRVIVVVQPGWHHGVIGIVASRLVERYGVPVFIGTYEEENPDVIRGSARGIPEFHVFEGLQFCDNILTKYGGHRAAGGFSLPAKNLDEFRFRLVLYAHQQLLPDYLKPLVTIDVEANFEELTLDLYHQIDRLHPCGIENADPIFWTPNVRIAEQRTIGRDRSHMKLTLVQGNAPPVDATVELPANALRAIAWRWGDYCPLPSPLDVAYRLKLNEWNGQQAVELELVGVRFPQSEEGTREPGAIALPVSGAGVADMPKAKRSRSKKAASPPPPPPIVMPLVPDPWDDPVGVEVPQVAAESHTDPLPEGAIAEVIETPWSDETLTPPMESLDLPETVQQPDEPATITEPEPEFPGFADDQPSLSPKVDEAINRILPKKVEFYYNKRKYSCSISVTPESRELRIRNPEGQVLAVQPYQRHGLLGHRRDDASAIDVSQPHYFNLIRAALTALELEETRQLLHEKNKLLAEKDQQVLTLSQQVQILDQQIAQLSQEQQQKFQDLQAKLQERETAIKSHEGLIQQLQNQQISQPEKPLTNEQRKQHLIEMLGKTAWDQLNKRSQTDLNAAYKHYDLIRSESFTAQVTDYSEAGLRLSLVVEREVIQPCFKALHSFILSNGGTDELGGIKLRSRKKYTLGMLPPLLSPDWYVFRDDALSQSQLAAESELYTLTNAGTVVSPGDRTWIQRFLQDWDHPISQWIRHSEIAAASTLDQIQQLQTLAAAADRLLHEWQFEQLHSLIIGGDRQRGLLQELYPPA
jgi:single-stranded-DNA-specific exonuclease RecJ